MGKPGRPLGRTYPRTVKVGLTAEQFSWVGRMSEVMGVSVAEAARMFMEVGMANTVKSEGDGDG